MSSSPRRARARRGAVGRLDRQREALELRDGQATLPGKGVLKAVSHINGEIARA